MTSMLAKLQSLLKRTPPPKPKPCRLHATEAGLSSHRDDEELWAFRWDEVSHLLTYKADLFAVDMICLDFVVGPRRLLRHTDDEMQGFDVLCRNLRLYYPSVGERWWFDVAFPAFATNGKILYEAQTQET